MSLPLSLLAHVTGFQWDAGNDTKNWAKHDVAQHECEEVFYNRPLRLLPDPQHSQVEKRYFAQGRTDGGRLLLVGFTFRGTLIRPITARDMDARERAAFNRFRRQ